jgi:hypothetical protein
MVAGVMMRRPRGVAVERVLPQRVPRRQVQLQVAAVRHNLDATTSGAGVSHLCCCRRRVLLVCKCRTGMEPPLYDGLAVLCYELLGAVETLFLDGTLGLLLYSQPTSTSPVQLVLSFFPSLRLVGRNLGKSPIYEEVIFNFY